MNKMFSGASVEGSPSAFRDERRCWEARRPFGSTPTLAASAKVHTPRRASRHLYLRGEGESRFDSFLCHFIGFSPMAHSGEFWCQLKPTVTRFV